MTTRAPGDRQGEGVQVSSSEGVANHTVPESWRRVHGVRLVAAVDLARVGYDRGPDVTGQSTPENQVRTGLPAGGKWIRTLGPSLLILGEEKGRRSIRVVARRCPFSRGDQRFESLYPSKRLLAGRYCRLAGPGRPAGSSLRILCFEHLEKTCTPAGRPRRKSCGRLRLERQYRD